MFYTFNASWLCNGLSALCKCHSQPCTRLGFHLVLRITYSTLGRGIFKYCKARGKCPSDSGPWWLPGRYLKEARRVPRLCQFVAYKVKNGYGYWPQLRRERAEVSKWHVNDLLCFFLQASLSKSAVSQGPILQLKGYRWSSKVYHFLDITFAHFEWYYPTLQTVVDPAATRTTTVIKL